MTAPGRLQVLLGAASGVGTTCAMLDEAHRLIGEGKDVVIGIVESRGRAATTARAEGIPKVPPARRGQPGEERDELDLEAVLARSPQVVLVDDLAHTNAPGAPLRKRWQEVTELLRAGIDVISTTKIEHVESVHHTAQQLTGAPQPETVPDHVLRDADRVEIIDLDPQMLRRRVAAGLVHPAERLDAAWANYYRFSTLSALRDLTLHWVTGDDAVRREHHHDGTGYDEEAHERAAREPADVDVLLDPHSATSGLTLPRFRSALTTRRRIAGFAITVLGSLLLLMPLGLTHTPESIVIEVLSYQFLIVVVALVGGIWPALFAAVLSGVTLDLFFIEPHFTVAIADPVHLLVLLLHIAIASLVSLVVDQAARQTHAARRAASESALLQSVAGSVLHGQDAVHALVTRTREAFSLDAVRLIDADGRVLASDGEPTASPSHTAPAGEGALLELYGPELPGSEQRLLSVVVTQLATALERRELEETASAIEPIAASDRVRGALLSALSHDLRRPLAAATTAVGGLRAAGEELSPTDRRELLDTAHESLGALTDLVTDLLDVSRVQAGALAISLAPFDPMDVIVPALEELGLDQDEVQLSIAHGNAQILADPTLLQRAMVNVLANALRYSRSPGAVRVATSAGGDRVEIRVIDHGPGIPPDRRDEVFLPFQRLGDTDNTTGLGLGLALSRGFVEAMHGTLTPQETPGGGLTMIVAMRARTGAVRAPNDERVRAEEPREVDR